VGDIIRQVERWGGLGGAGKIGGNYRKNVWGGNRFSKPERKNRRVKGVKQCVTHKKQKKQTHRKKPVKKVSGEITKKRKNQKGKKPKRPRTNDPKKTGTTGEAKK